MTLDVFVVNRATFINTKSYVLSHALTRFKKAGIKFRVLENMRQSHTEGHNAFMHVDLTVLPKSYRKIAKKYRQCINGNAISIAKNIFSQAILTKESCYSGPVIIKTNLNHKGLPELVLAIRRGTFGAFNLVNRKLLERKYAPEYKLLKSIQDVPPVVWDNSRLIVEKFIPGNLDLPVVKYRHDFIFDIELNTKGTFDSLLCNPAKLVEIEFHEEVPIAVRNLRKELNLDYGSMDYFIVDDKVFIIDANKTTALTKDWIDKFPKVKRYINNASERLIEFSRN